MSRLPLSASLPDFAGRRHSKRRAAGESLHLPLVFAVAFLRPIVSATRAGYSVRRD